MNAAIVGAGSMGKLLLEMVRQSGDITCGGMIEPLSGQSLFDIEMPVDVVIDFSNPANLPMVEQFVRQRKCGAVIATTGFGPEQVDAIRALSQVAPVVFTANCSLGITVMKKVCGELSRALSGSFDMEIVEKHHNRKLDAPSGTAKMLAGALNPDGEYELVFGRDGNRKRGKEIGVHAVRGGTIAGEHAVIFAGEDEIIELTHIAHSKRIFAAGALTAARFVCGREAGLYDMGDVLFT